MSEVRKGALGTEYDLIRALRKARTLIMAGDYITDVAADRILELKKENARLRDQIEFLNNQTSGP